MKKAAVKSVEFLSALFGPRSQGNVFMGVMTAWPQIKAPPGFARTRSG